jgi:divalent metal cation (Fe/Co/Zn/Cd) transporter
LNVAVGSPSVLDREARVRRLQALTVAWMTVEAAVAISAGVRRDSPALVAFGGDSAIELFSAIVVWLRFTRKWRIEERTAARIAGALLFVLACYVAAVSAFQLAGHSEAERSIVGIILLIAAGAFMPLLARAKRRLSAATGSAALRADASQSAMCAYLAWISLIGVGLNAWRGWSWADPVAAFCLLPVILREAWESARGHACC